MAKRKPTAGYADHLDALKQYTQDLPHIIVLEGEEPTLRREARHVLTSNLEKKYSGIETLVFHGPAKQNEAGIPLSDILSEMDAGSLFSCEKIISLRQADLLLFCPGGDDSRATSLERFVERVSSPSDDVWLIIECKKLNRSRKAGKALASHASIIPCPTLNKQHDVGAWMRNAAKKRNKTIENGVVDILFTSHGAQLGAIAGEIEKLAIFVGTNDVIRAEDAQEFMSDSVEFEIFRLTNAIEQRDGREALRYARRIGVQGLRDADGKKNAGDSSVHSALFMVARTMEQLLCARAALGTSGNDQDVADAVGCAPWRARKLAEGAERYSLAELRRGISLAAETHRATHDTGSDAFLALETLVVRCCGIRN